MATGQEGEPGPALARYRAHDRLHVYDTRAEATQAMVDNVRVHGFEQGFLGVGA